LCSRDVVKYGGRVVEDAPAAANVAAPQHPYTAAQMSCLPSTETEPGVRLPEITGEQPSPITLVRPGCSFAPRCPLADSRCHSESPPLHSREQGWRVECWKPGEILTAWNVKGGVEE